jgi:hypothetical protein
LYCIIFLVQNILDGHAGCIYEPGGSLILDEVE